MTNTPQVRITKADIYEKADDYNRDRARSRSPPRLPSSDTRHTTSRRGSPPPPSSTTRNNNPPTSKKPSNPTTPMDLDDPNLTEQEREALRLKKTMGFAAFRSTKNTKVPGNDRLYGVRRDKQVQYRQYMNRSGGFNRPLSPSQM